MLAAPVGVAAQVPDSIPAGTVRVVTPLGVAPALLVPPSRFRSSGGETQSPCDRRSVPAFDRWAIGRYRSGWQWASDLGLIAVAGFVTADLAARGDEAQALTALGAGLLTAGVTEVLKRAIGRPRPERYLTGGADPGDRACRGRSFPSGHTSVAFAFATTYWRARRDLDGRAGAPGWLALAGAAGVGVSRVAAGRHFPSDVVAGAMLGSAGALLVYEIRF